ncbi:hypothetical protein ACJX0J_032928, partial [Zea mays]
SQRSRLLMLKEYEVNEQIPLLKLVNEIRASILFTNMTIELNNFNRHLNEIWFHLSILAYMYNKYVIVLSTNGYGLPIEEAYTRSLLVHKLVGSHRLTQIIFKKKTPMDEWFYNCNGNIIMTKKIDDIIFDMHIIKNEKKRDKA